MSNTSILKEKASSCDTNGNGICSPIPTAFILDKLWWPILIQYIYFNTDYSFCANNWYRYLAGRPPCNNEQQFSHTLYLRSRMNFIMKQSKMETILKETNTNVCTVYAVGLPWPTRHPCAVGSVVVLPESVTHRHTTHQKPRMKIFIILIIK
jgi:hypothetical protein